MPYTYVIQNRRENCRMQVLLDCRSQQRRQWLGEVPKNEADASPWPWFLKETDRNWGTRHSELKGRRSCFCDAVQRFPNLMHRSILCSFANCIRLPMFCLQFAGLDLAILSLTISCQSEVSCAVPVQRNAYKRQKAMQFMSCRKHIPDPLLYTNGEKCHIKRLGLRKMCFINRAPLMDRYWGRASALKVLQPFDRP